MKKIFFLVIGLIAVFLTGCGDSKPIETSEITGKEIKSDVKAEIKIWSWDVAALGLKETIPSFNKKYPNVKVIVEEVGSGDTYQKLTIGLNSNTGLPDIMTIETDVFIKYPPNFPNGFYDLTKVSANLENDFDPSKWQLGMYENKLYALPWDSAPAGIFYRRDFFENGGVDPETIKTWDDFIEAGKKIQAANPGVKMIPINYAKETSIHSMMVNSLGSGNFNSEGQITVADESNIKALKMQKRFIDEDISYNADSWNTLVIATKNDEVATVLYGGWWGGTLKDQMPEQSGKWGVIPIPSFEKNGKRVSYSGGASLAIPSQSKNAELAWEFIKNAVATKENQLLMYKKYDLFPSYLPTFEDKYFKKGDPYFAGQKVSELFAKMVPFINKEYGTEDDSEAIDYLLDAQAAVLTGDADVEKVLKNAAEAIKTATHRSIAD